MAKVIADGYRRLCATNEPAPRDESAFSLAELVGDGEGADVEFKSTLRINVHTRSPDPRMELACLKTIAGFLNMRGGKLIIGVGDSGEPVGIGSDRFPSEDKMHLHLINLIKDRLGPHHMLYIHPRFEDFKEARVMVVECWKARSPVYLKDSSVERFYVRTGASTTELTGSQMQEYIKRRF